MIEEFENVAFKLEDIWAIQKVDSPNVVNPSLTKVNHQLLTTIHGILLYGKGQPLLINFKTEELRDRKYKEILNKMKGEVNRDER